MKIGRATLQEVLSSIAPIGKRDDRYYYVPIAPTSILGRLIYYKRGGVWREYRNWRERIEKRFGVKMPNAE